MAFTYFKNNCILLFHVKSIWLPTKKKGSKLFHKEWIIQTVCMLTTKPKCTEIFVYLLDITYKCISKLDVINSCARS